MNWGVVFLITLGLFITMLIAYLVFKRVNAKKLERIRKEKKGEK